GWVGASGDAGARKSGGSLSASAAHQGRGGFVGSCSQSLIGVLPRRLWIAARRGDRAVSDSLVGRPGHQLWAGCTDSGCSEKADGLGPERRGDVEADRRAPLI